MSTDTQSEPTGQQAAISQPEWVEWPDDRLLDLRLCDLHVSIEGSALEDRIAQLYRELEARGLAFRPHCWLSDEWFSPDGVPGIAIPFYLAHPRLAKLELNQMLEVEGGTPEWCLRILRHEAGHAIENGFQLRRRRRRRQLFGRSSVPYPDHYAFKPYSKSYVEHLGLWYAQSHPDEDFAETFAVWLTPGSDWARRYAGYPVLKKLRYVERLMRSLVGRAPVVVSQEQVDPLRRLRKTLRQHYTKKRRHYGVGRPAFYDRDLKRLFSDAGEHADRVTAVRFLTRIRKPVRRLVAGWTGLYQYTIDQVFEDIVARCQQLDLRLAVPEEQAKLEFAILHRPCHEPIDHRKIQAGAMKPLRVLVLVHTHLVPPASASAADVEQADWKTEYHVVSTLRRLGHEVKALGLHDDLSEARRAISDWEPDIVFNLLEAFDNVVMFDYNIVGFLEMLRMPYTGTNSRGLMLARDKALSKKLLAYHRIPVPEFTVIKKGQRARLPKHLVFPVIVKSLTEEASLGISQASVVDGEEKLVERVAFVHDSVGTDALVERFIEGRELYVRVIGNRRLRVLPVWEMQFTKMPNGAHHIATERVKWSAKYQEKCGVKTAEVKDLTDDVKLRIQHVCRRVYRALDLNGYARIDLRMAPEGKIYVLEANPNPQIARDEDFAESAKAAGVSYAALIQRIVTLGLQWRPERVG